MKTVDVIYPSFIRRGVGPTTNLIHFLENRDSIIKYGIQYKIFSKDFFIENISQNTNKYNNTIYTIAKSFKSIIKKTSHKNAYLSWLVINRSLLASQQHVKQYLEIFPESDFVDFQEIFSCYWYLKQRKNRKSKVILFHHGNGDAFKMFRIYYPKLERSKYYKKLNDIKNYVLERIDRLVFISELAKDKFLLEHINFPRSKAIFFHNGIPPFDQEQVKQYSEIIQSRDYTSYKLICVGTLNMRKGQELLIKALSKLNKIKISRISLVLIGGGDRLEEFKKLSKRLNLDDRIHFTGNIQNVNEFLLKSNIFILPSKDEGLPISIIEGMRAHLPIIGTRIAGIPEMIQENYNGVLVEPCVESLVDVLNHLDKYDWQTLGNNSFDVFNKKFTLDLMIKRYCEMINDILL